MIWTAIILGFAGSLHCLGMCSPLAMTVTHASPTVLVSRVLYNLGRVLTYGFLGGMISSVGLIFPMAKYQNLLSILLGFVLLAIGMSGISTLRIRVVTAGLARFNFWLKKLFGRLLRQKSYTTIFLLGSLNGFLPCGLSFLALTYCLTLAGPWDGFSFMAYFGLGTLPVMLGLTTVFDWILRTFKLSSQRLTTAMMIISGALLIVRAFIVHLPQAKSLQDGVVDIVLCR